MVSCCRSLGACRDTGNFGLRVKTTQVVKNCCKSALISEISRVKVPKKGYLRRLRLMLSHLPPKTSDPFADGGLAHRRTMTTSPITFSENEPVVCRPEEAL